MGLGHSHSTSHGHHHGATPHGQGHDGGHSHGHYHPTPPKAGSHSKAFAIAVTLNLLFVIAETAAGLLSGSMALLADAGHNLSDVLSLILAWIASILTARPPSERFTYGLKSSSILATIANAALLWIAIGAILIETIRRIAEPSPIAGTTMIVVASIGIAVNALSALLFLKGSKDDLNIRAAFIHLMADALVSVGVVIAGIVITWSGWALIDPITSLVITAVIAWSSWGLLRDSLKMGMLGVPENIDLTTVRQFLLTQNGVTALHDLHIWPMSTTETALTVHLVMPNLQQTGPTLRSLSHAIEHEFGITHVTIQIETDPLVPCTLECSQP